MPFLNQVTKNVVFIEIIIILWLYTSTKQSKEHAPNV
jgi:hypothetical protein